jgi:hypothetical protein
MESFFDFIMYYLIHIYIIIWKILNYFDILIFTFVYKFIEIKTKNDKEVDKKNKL